MRYDERDEESKNVEDRRGQGGGFGGGMPGGIQIPIGGRGGMSLTSLLIIGALMLLFGINPLDVLTGGGGGGGNFPNMPQMPRTETTQRPAAGDNIPGLPGQAGSASGATDDEMGRFIKLVLRDTEKVWNQVFASFGDRYKEPQLVIFDRGTRTACGMGMTQMGPFYCPLDQKIYIDLAFYDELKRRFNAPGDFAQAYVVAHEVGHHVQTLLGIADKVQGMKQRMGEREANALQVRMELQADCLAGVWANLNHQLNNRLEPGDIEEGLRAANAIGDDMIQKKTQGHVVPDAFTHGSAAQRMRWFSTGYKSGQMQSCDTFGTDDL
jgi:predicted metalloprotease